jgi:hypothetical protein
MLLDDDVAQKFSIKGQQNNKSKFGELKLVKVIFGEFII